MILFSLSLNSYLFSYINTNRYSLFTRFFLLYQIYYICIAIYYLIFVQKQQPRVSFKDYRFNFFGTDFRLGVSTTSWRPRSPNFYDIGIPLSTLPASRGPNLMLLFLCNKYFKLFSSIISCFIFQIYKGLLNQSKFALCNSKLACLFLGYCFLYFPPNNITVQLNNSKASAQTNHRSCTNC